MDKIQILWFRRDLRIEDNPILAVENNFPVLPIFIFDSNILSNLDRTDRRITFLFEQILNLKSKLKAIGLDLAIFSGQPKEVFEFLQKSYEIEKIFASSDNDPYSKQRDLEIQNLNKLHIVKDNFVVDPKSIVTKDGKAYTIFTHFKNAVKPQIEIYRVYKSIFPNPKLELAEYSNFDKLVEVNEEIIIVKPLEIDSIGFQRQNIQFEGALKSPFQLLSEFQQIAKDYDTFRNFPSQRGTSLLSTHLRFGTISIREVFRWALQNNYHSFVSELIWREFFNYVLFHFPETTRENLQKNVKIIWKNNPEDFERWKKGETGIPIVDAGIRELVETGYMHNRVRMIVASFLTKNLLVDWRFGEEFFARFLFDYELSSNIGNWQWVAGVGTDPRSATRIFNPFLQSKKFDPDCNYIYKYVPELKGIPPEKIHNPDFIFSNKIMNYPEPIVKDINATKVEFYRAYQKQK